MTWLDLAQGTALLCRGTALLCRGSAQLETRITAAQGSGHADSVWIGSARLATLGSAHLWS